MNRLGHETSPYLLQHADNPVAWHPWGPEALSLARSEAKPILLSIGYSACHWCHVMAHESFEDPATAELMNRHFVNIKVDREERPDLDKIYQLAHQLLTGRGGGWPLTMFLTPDDQAPFFGGTYFPREGRFGLPAFKDLLAHVAAAYQGRQQDIRGQNRSLLDSLRGLGEQIPSTRPLSSAPLTEARAQLGRNFDRQFGGFGAAPKFPHPLHIERLLRQYAASLRSGSPDATALEMALHTLRQMALGGIYDQLGGGFCRYSVDERWMIPHFEKMLYDNGPLSALYSVAWQLTGETLFKNTAIATGEWALREMQAPEGGFYSSLDADSEGVEGKFYVWDAQEVRSLLDIDTYRICAAHLGLDLAPNFEGHWHLRVTTPVATIAAGLGRPAAEIEDTLAAARATLFRARQQRIPPGRDDKVLTSWNALMIKGLAVAGRVFERADLVAAAERALDFVYRTLWRGDRLLATAKDGRAHLNAYLDDYAFLIDAVLALCEARWREGDIDFAVALAEAMLARFEDRERGGFYFTSHDHEALLLRTPSLADDALPAGAGVAAQVLGRLGHLLGETRYLEAQERTLVAACEAMHRYPGAHSALLSALEEHLAPPEIVVIRAAGASFEEWRRRALRAFAPRRLTLAIPSTTTALPGLLATRHAGAAPVAYLCAGLACRAPFEGFEDLDAALRDNEVSPLHEPAFAQAELPLSSSDTGGSGG